MKSLKLLLVTFVSIYSYSSYAASTSLVGPIITPFPCADMPALTGDTTSSSGSCATTDNFHLVGGPTTVTASSAGIQFTSLPAGYNTLYLNCDNLTLSSTSNAFLIQVGEGGTPTWETGAHYTLQFFFASGASAVSADHSTTRTDLSDSLGVASTSIPSSIKLTLDNYTSTTVNKMALVWASAPASSSFLTYQIGTSYWNSDTNAITGLQIVPSAGTMGATCTLYAYK